MFAELLALVLPAVCAGCGLAGPAWCLACTAALAPRPRLVVPSPPPAGFPVTTASADYDGVARAALLAHKEHGRRAARPALGTALAAAIDAVVVEARVAGAAAAGVTAPPHRPIVVIPVPSSASAIRARGGDPVGAMAAAAARRAGGRVTLITALQQQRRLADQAGLDTAGRQANLAGAFGLRPQAVSPLRAMVSAGATVVIVDDVCTTGATLAEAARALRSLPGPPGWPGAGTVEPVAAVVAATRKRHPCRPPP